MCIRDRYMTEDAEIVIAAFGIAARVSKNAITEARKKGIKVGMIRPITLWPVSYTHLIPPAATT